jgi:hypothetical protein
MVLKGGDPLKYKEKLKKTVVHACNVACDRLKVCYLLATSSEFYLSLFLGHVNLINSWITSALGWGSSSLPHIIIASAPPSLADL